MTTRSVHTQQSAHACETRGRIETAADTARISTSCSESCSYDANAQLRRIVPGS